MDLQPALNADAALEAYFEMDFEHRAAFCLELARALQAVGTPAHRFEDAMARVCARMGLEADFFALPTGFLVSLRRDGSTQTHLVRAEGGGTDLAKLTRLHEVVRAAANGDCSVAEARDRLKAVMAAPPAFGPAVVVAGWVLASATGARFFGGGTLDILLSGGLGLLVGLLSLALGQRKGWSLVFPLLAATLVGSLGAWAASRVPGTSDFTMILAGIVILLPGLRLTIALREVATGNLVAGSARLTDAGMVLMMLAFGVGAGRQIALQFWGAPGGAASRYLPPWTDWAALALAPLAYHIFFQARRRDFGWIFLGCWIAFLGSRWGADWMGPELGAALGACALGVAANAMSRLTKLPSQVMLLPGLILLVPGSIGFRGLAFLTMGQTVTGIETAFRMLFVAVALVVGLSLAQAILPPRPTI